jgi:hypothetical protein
MDKLHDGDAGYTGLIEKISGRYTYGVRQAVLAVNTHLVET